MLTLTLLEGPIARIVPQNADAAGSTRLGAGDFDCH